MGRERSFYATLLVLGVSQGASYALIRYAVHELPPAVLMELRIVFAVPVLLAICVVTGRVRQLRAAIRPGVAVGVPGFAVTYLLIGWGSVHVDAGVVAVANAAVPIFVALLAIWILPSERPTGLRLLGVVVGLVGVALLAGVHPEGGWWSVAGTLAVVAAAPAYALSFFAAQRARDVDAVAVATTALACGGIVLLPIALATAPHSLPAANVVAATALLGVACTALSTVLFYWMLSWHGASRASLLTYVTPLFTFAIAAWLLDEPLTATKIGSLTLIVGGVALAAGGVAARSRRPAVVPAG